MGEMFMNNIYEQLMYTTLRIENINENNEVISIGTGFLLRRPIGDNKFKIYLVSNKHVLCYTDSIAIKFTKAKDDAPDIGNSIRFTIKNIICQILFIDFENIF